MARPGGGHADAFKIVAGLGRARKIALVFSIGGKTGDATTRHHHRQFTLPQRSPAIGRADSQYGMGTEEFGPILPSKSASRPCPFSGWVMLVAKLRSPKWDAIRRDGWVPGSSSSA